MPTWRRKQRRFLRARLRLILILPRLMPGWRSLFSAATGSTPTRKRCTRRQLPHSELWTGQQRSDGSPLQRHGHGVAPRTRASRRSFRPRRRPQSSRRANSRGPRNWLRYSGHPEEALASLDDALRRTPFPPHWFWRIRGGIFLELRRYGEAVEAIDNMPQKNHIALLTLAAAHAQLGHAALAVASAEQGTRAQAKYLTAGTHRPCFLMLIVRRLIL